jgi:hypothetical protein
MKTCRCLLLVSFAVVAWPYAALAHREDYLDETLVYQTLEHGEFEPEYWFDYGRQRDEGIDFMRHHVSAEYGLTEHWMIDARATMLKAESDGLRFDSARLETRYRFAEEGTLPVDIALSGEMNVERDEAGVDRTAIEPRLILSHDFGDLNFTLNLSEEIPFDSRAPQFLIATGLRYDATKLFRCGSEFKYSLQEQQASVIPQIWITLPHDLTLKLGYSYGFDHNRENFLRFAVECGF